ncbi:hypothetical protein [Winogradskyella forsetii]|uniref:hypothetical protein n=1 Tax=Winogradskyella forsetii TaxID=2686077 RepID=UPI0015B87756|nr:hypothetical protein [Winogradskyella forsetii]
MLTRRISKKIARNVPLFLISLALAFISCEKDNDYENTGGNQQPTFETQEIVLNVEDYKHQFIGGGVSIGLFLGHHYSMNETAQDQAIQMIAKDCNMKYLQDYIQIYPVDDPPYFDRRANYVKAAKIYRPEIEFSLVGNKFPDDLLHDITVNGETLQALNTDDPLIYDRLAQWYFDLFKGFYDRGVSVEILNVVNEPDLDRTFRKHHYGLNGDTKEAVARIFKYAVPKFKDLLNNPAVNTTGMQVPLIMGPSTISPAGCIDYINFFKSEHPDVWNEIDIVATHQYEYGGNSLLFDDIANSIEDKRFYQSETHAQRGDDLSYVSVDDPLDAALSLSNLFSTAVGGGVSSWYYFENNYPNEFHPGGLLSVPWNAQEPVPYKHYYAFKQLTSTQPSNSHILGYTNPINARSDVLAFRKMDQDTLYLNYSNYTNKNREITLIMTDGNSEKFKAGSYSVITTDENNNEVLTASETFSTALDTLRFTVNKFSINTVKISIEDE